MRSPYKLIFLYLVLFLFIGWKGNDNFFSGKSGIDSSCKIDTLKRRPAFEKTTEAQLMFFDHRIEPTLKDSERNQKSISLVDEALAIDSTYINAYVLKAQMLNNDSLFQDAMDVVDKAFQYTDYIEKENKIGKTVGLLLLKGLLLERMKYPEQAKDFYEKIIAVYDSLLQKEPSLLQAQIHRAYFEVLISDEFAARKKLIEIKSRNKKLSKEEMHQLDFLIEMLDQETREEIVSKATVN
jgi:tetratricopeptide (TPR) repeat protein